MMPALLGVVALLLLVCAGGVGAMFCLPVVGLTVLGQSLDNTFDEISREVEP